MNPSPPIFFYVLIRSWNSFEFLNQCIESVFSQNYPHYQIIFIDDCSEYSREQKVRIREKLKNHVVVFNSSRYYSLRNAYYGLHNFVHNQNAVVFNIDGDDYLARQDAFELVAKVYQSTNCLLTYGECHLIGYRGLLGRKLPSRYLLHRQNIRYSKKVEIDNSYRRHYFLPLHSRTWKLSLFLKIKKSDFLHPDGSWFRTCEDQAMFYPMLEMAGGRYQVIQTPHYNYRIEHSKSDYILNQKIQHQEEQIIRSKPPYMKLQSL